MKKAPLFSVLFFVQVMISQAQFITSTTSPIFTAATGGTSTVQASDNQGLNGKPANDITNNPLSDMVELFQVSNDTICTNYELNQVISTLSGAATYSWVFSDGHTSNQAHPNHSFAAPGNYTATLTITTTPDQFLITAVTIISRASYFSITDPIPDLYILVKNIQGQVIYRSDTHYNVSSFELPYTIPTVFLVKNEFHIVEIWDYDAFDSDDFLGEVFLSNPTVAGTYSTDPASIAIDPVNAADSYSWSRDFQIIAPYISYNDGILTAHLDKSGSFTYTWYHNNTVIGGGISDTLIPPAAEGCYTVKVTGGNVCEETSAPYCFTVGTDENQATLFNDMVIAPQPLKSGRDLQLFLHESGVWLNQIELFNALGQLVFSKNDIRYEPVFMLPTANLHLRPGIYSLRLIDKNGHAVSKNIMIAE